MAYLDYKIENSEPIGSGGNANVYLAKNVKTGSMVALKELKTGGRFFEEKKDRFCIETRLVQKIQDSVKGIIPIEQNRCAMVCQGCGAVLFLLKKQWNYFP